MLLALAMMQLALAAAPSVAVGYTHREQRDLHASPLRYGGHAPTLQLGLDGEVVSAWLDLRGVHWNPSGVGHRTLQITERNPLTDEDSSFFIEVPHWGVAGQLGLQAAWPVGPVLLGPRLSATAHYATLSMNTWALQETSLDARVALPDLPLGPGALSLGAWLPLAAAHTRMPYGLDPLIDGRTQAASFLISGTTLQSWGRRQAVGAEASWRRPGEAWDIGVKASLAWSHSAVPDDLYAIDGQLLLTAWRVR